MSTSGLPAAAYAKLVDVVGQDVVARSGRSRIHDGGRLGVLADQARGEPGALDSGSLGWLRGVEARDDVLPRGVDAISRRATHVIGVRARCGVGVEVRRQRRQAGGDGCASIGETRALDVDPRRGTVRCTDVAIGTGVADEWFGVRRDLCSAQQVEHVLDDGRVDVDELGVRRRGEAGRRHGLSSGGGRSRCCR